MKSEKTGSSFPSSPSFPLQLYRCRLGQKGKEKERKKKEIEGLFYSSQFGNKKATRSVCLGKEGGLGSYYKRNKRGVLKGCLHFWNTQRIGFVT